VFHKLILSIELDCSPASVDAMFSAMWEQGLDTDEPGQIQSPLWAAKLDAAALLDKSQDPAVKARLQAHTQQAYDSGAFGSPTRLVGEEIFFGKDRWREVEEEIVRASSLSAVHSAG